MTQRRRKISFRGTSGADLRDFPSAAMNRMGYELGRIQAGLEQPIGRHSKKSALARGKSGSRLMVRIFAQCMW
jgi:phage-related protein